MGCEVALIERHGTWRTKFARTRDHLRGGVRMHVIITRSGSARSPAWGWGIARKCASSVPTNHAGKTQRSMSLAHVETQDPDSAIKGEV